MTTEVLPIMFIVARTLVRMWAHPTTQLATRTMDECGLHAFLGQLEHVLIELEQMFPGLTEAVLAASVAGVVTREQLAEVLREVGLAEADVQLAFSGAP